MAIDRMLKNGSYYEEKDPKKNRLILMDDG